MDEMLKGNYSVDKNVKAEKDARIDDDVTSIFESKAIEKLGGSIAFVSKSKLVWSEDDAK